MRPSRFACLRMRPAKGSNSRANANGAILFMPFSRCSAAVVAGNRTVSVTVCVPEPAASMAGEKTYVTPGGNPLAESVIAVGKVVEPTGLMVTIKTAVPPGCTVAEVTDAVPLEPVPPEKFTLKSNTVSVSALLAAVMKFASPE